MFVEKEKTKVTVTIRRHVLVLTGHGKGGKKGKKGGTPFSFNREGEGIDSIQKLKESLLLSRERGRERVLS